MIVAAVDDLMLRSRISTAAGQSGADVRFVTRPEQVLSLAAAGAALIIFDLNSPRVDAVAATRALKARPDLATIPTLGFVSHVDAAAIAAARDAGIGEVLARGAFVAQVAGILARASSPVLPESPVT
jgi:CheY-like chemotaxis protein